MIIVKTVGDPPRPPEAAAATVPPAPTPSPHRRRRLLDARLVVLVVVVAAGSRGLIADLFNGPVLQTWSTLFVSITIQALPFLVLGVLLSGAIAALLPPGWLARVLPRRDVLAVPAAGLAGAALPGCECASVPIAARLRDRGVSPAAAFAFMLAAPAINPVVLVATAVAFPGRPQVVAARFLASLCTSVVVGLVWSPSRPSPQRSGIRCWSLARSPRSPRPPTATNTTCMPSNGFWVLA